MPRFDDRAREELLDEYARLKAQNISDAQIARRFGVSQMTILRWKQKYGLASRTAPAACPPPAEAPRGLQALAADEERRARLARTPVASNEAGSAPPDVAALMQENAWLRELASRLLLENEQLRARLAGRLPQGADAE